MTSILWAIVGVACGAVCWASMLFVVTRRKPFRFATAAIGTVVAVASVYGLSVSVKQLSNESRKDQVDDVERQIATACGDTTHRKYLVASEVISDEDRLLVAERFLNACLANNPATRQADKSAVTVAAACQATFTARQFRTLLTSSMTTRDIQLIEREIVASCSR